MTDRDWNVVNSRRERRRNRDDELREERLRAEAPNRPLRTRDLAWFDATHPQPSGTADDYEYNHAQRYGVEERMINGRHRRGIPTFPNNSDRDIAHARYDDSTQHRNSALESYLDAKRKNAAEIKKLDAKERGYYKHSTDGLLPSQHADMSGRALDLADAAYA